MAQFKLNEPVVQPEADVRVEVNRRDPLPVGANRFRLVVVDDDGAESEPTFIDVIVQAQERPTAVLDFIDAEGRRAEPVVPFGASFALSGKRSSDVDPGRIVEFRFTLVDRG